MGQAAFHHPRNQVRVHVAATKHHRHLLPSDLDFPSQHRGKPNRASPFHEQLAPLQEKHHGLSDLILLNYNHVVHIAQNQGNGELPRRTHGDPIGYGGLRLHREEPVGLARVDNGGGRRNLHADHPDAGRRLLYREGDTRYQASTPHGHDNRVQVAHLLEHLQADRSLPRNDGRVVEGVDEGQVVLLHDPFGMHLGLVEVIAFEQHRRSVAPCGLHLGEGGPHGHDNGAGYAGMASRQGNSLGVVTGAGGDHALGLLVWAQGSDLVGSAPDFEGTRSL